MVGQRQRLTKMEGDVALPVLLGMAEVLGLRRPGRNRWGRLPVRMMSRTPGPNSPASSPPNQSPRVLPRRTGNHRLVQRVTANMECAPSVAPAP